LHELASRRCTIEHSLGKREWCPIVFRPPLVLDSVPSLRSAADLFRKASEAYAACGEAAMAEAASRKEAWCCNELGRQCGGYGGQGGQGDWGTGGAGGCGGPGEGLAEQEKWFLLAAEKFRSLNDTANCVFALCNLGHIQRSRAEAMLPACRSASSAGQRLQAVSGIKAAVRSCTEAVL